MWLRIIHFCRQFSLRTIFCEWYKIVKTVHSLRGKYLKTSANVWRDPLGQKTSSLKFQAQWLHPYQRCHRSQQVFSFWQLAVNTCRFQQVESISFSPDLVLIYPLKCQTQSFTLWNTGHVLDRDHVYLDFLQSVTGNALVQTSRAVKLLVVFCCCCFYREINTRGRHSMMCTLWMGWQVIDSMRMEKRWRKEESEERSYRWVCWMCEAGLSVHCRIVQMHGDVQ